jgi:asparagine synthase (glutamine-hydrolysing)
MSTTITGQLMARAQVFTLSPTAKSLRRRHLTYLIPSRLKNIEWAVEEVKSQGVAGSFLETGLALGGSGILIATHLDGDREFHGYDVFGQIPAPGERDPDAVHERYEVITSGESKGLGGEEYYGYRPDLLAEVKESFAEFGVPVDGERIQLHKGLFEDTLHLEGPVAFAHVDCDWYEPVKLTMERIYEWLEPGGIVICDDYYDYGGAQEAVDEFRAANPELAIVEDRSGSHLVLQRR